VNHGVICSRVFFWMIAFQTVKYRIKQGQFYLQNFGCRCILILLKIKKTKLRLLYVEGTGRDYTKIAAGLGERLKFNLGFTFQFSDGWWEVWFCDRKNGGYTDIMHRGLMVD